MSTASSMKESLEVDDIHPDSSLAILRTVVLRGLRLPNKWWVMDINDERRCCFPEVRLWRLVSEDEDEDLDRGMNLDVRRVCCFIVSVSESESDETPSKESGIGAVPKADLARFSVANRLETSRMPEVKKSE